MTKWVTGEITRVRAESPAAGILAFAGDDPDDLIVVATHGVGGRAASLLGSVAFELLCTAPQPLVLVPPDFEPAARCSPGGRVRRGGTLRQPEADPCRCYPIDTGPRCRPSALEEG